MAIKMNGIRNDLENASSMIAQMLESLLFALTPGLGTIQRECGF